MGKRPWSVLNTLLSELAEKGHLIAVLCNYLALPVLAEQGLSG